MRKITTTKLTKEDLLVLDKFSKINDKLFISCDKIQVIDGQLNPDGTSNNRFNGGNRVGHYRIMNPDINIVDDLGICSLPTFISLIKSLGDNHQIDVYEKYLIIRDGIINFKFWLTPKDKNIIPTVDSESVVNRAKNSTKPKIVFDISSEQLQKVFDVQRIIGTFTTFFSFDDSGNLNIKVSESFSENGSNIAIIKIDKESFVSNDLELVDGYNRFDYIRSDFIINDNYRIVLSQNGILLSGENNRTDYIVKATVK